ncbi:2-phosphosulfolactate phosphatase [Nitrospirillum viridazoti Y2]|uniref:Probable 2-phosphosulfolactate phosphatase n=1 Tax=Nitrospirillum amazonense TaxID=28077 RepID=A0A560IWH8_9PROT|nr:2-phosphosulfolactate phosphatase [Nitrospirillum amazonense]EGX99705.1 2-phosphosulfolactate phosphatase [Nitrospirillum amazonense Y2]TWB63408.1 2-phosphosulfolactate phosphatase [Nitrospirillum amazonense]
MTQTVHSEWGLAGVEALRERVAVLVIVDILSFSTAVDIATSRGAAILPFAYGDAAAAQTAADKAGAVLAAPRNAGGQLSLSPRSLTTITSGTRLMLPSPNGSRLSLAGGAAKVMAGCLRNVVAVARQAHMLAEGGDIAVIPAGERWPDGSLRPAVEDLLGAGAIIAALDLPTSAEARVARDAHRAAGPDLADIIRGSQSGRELAGWGYADDVELALELNVSTTAPVLRDGAYQAP